MPEYKVGLENITTKDAYLNSRPIWGRIINFYFYKIFLNFITFSPRRQFLILAAFPIVWLLTQHLGPMLQMLRVSLLEAYPVAEGTPHSFTIDNYIRFFGDYIFKKKINLS